MAGKRKGKRAKKREEKKLIDEYQLRRDLREKARHREESDLDQETIMSVEVASMKQADEIRIGGVEGGGTHSTLAVIDGRGNKLTEVKGPNTNHWGIGMEETVARINAMIEKAKQNLNIPTTVPLDSVGLCLSGCEEETTNQLLVNTLREKYPNAASDYIISSDILSSLRTGLERGGIVLIAGTGSNALLINPDGKMHTCGGWGHMMGDEGGGYWIAHRACKYVFDDMDNFVKSPHPISYIWPAMRNYFGVTNRNDMLPCLYTNFDKSKFAMFAKEIALGCEKGDSLCLWIFEECGQLLASHIIALSDKVHNDLQLAQGGLKVISVGSVWKSWQYMKNGFIKKIHNASTLNELTLLRLSTTAALGACYLAAEKIDCHFVKPYDANTEVFFHYKRDHYPTLEKVECPAEAKNT